MKKRLLSILLSVVMLLTMLSVSAFAAETVDDEDGISPQADKQTVPGEILSAHFYADAGKAEEAISELLKEIPEEKTFSLTDVGTIKDNALVVRYELTPSDEQSNITYLLQYGYQDDTYVAAKSLKPADRIKNNVKQVANYLSVFYLEPKTVNAIMAMQSHSFDVKLGVATENGGKILDDNYTLKSETVTLKTVTIDFGVIDIDDVTIVPADVIVKNTNTVYYTVPTDTQQKKSQVTVVADTSVLEGTKNSDAPTALIRFADGYQDKYLIDEEKAGKWTYTSAAEGDDFKWRYVLSADDIVKVEADPDYCENYSVYSGTSTTKKDPSPDAASNTVTLQASKLSINRNSVYGTSIGTDGYWIGFQVTAPEGAAYAFRGNAKTAAGLTLDKDNKVSETDSETGTESVDSLNFFVDPFNNKTNKFFCVQFFGANDVELTDEYKFTASSEVIYNATVDVDWDTDSDPVQAVVTLEEINTKFAAGAKNKDKTVTVDASGFTAKNEAIEVVFENDAANALAKKTSPLKIDTPYGSVQIPASRFNELFGDNGDLDVSLRIKPCKDDLFPSWVLTSEPASRWPLDACSIGIYKNGALIDLKDGDALKVALKFREIFNQGVTTLTAPLDEEEQIWGVQFGSKQSELPVIFDRAVGHTEDEPDYGTFEISKFGMYGVAPKVFANKMNIDAADDIITVTEILDSGDTVATLDNGLNDEGFSSDVTSYTLTTTAPKLKFTSTVDARYSVDGSSEQEIPASGCEVELTKSYTNVKIFINNRTYQITITRQRPEPLELGLVEAYVGDVKLDVCLVEITNAIPGREYFVQLTSVFKNQTSSVHSIVKMRDEEDAARFIVPAKVANKKVELKIFEINEQAVNTLDENGVPNTVKNVDRQFVDLDFDAQTCVPVTGS